MSASTFRIGDGQPVAYETATHLWAKSARDLLVEKARQYGADVTVDELAGEVQRRTGIKTRELQATWVTHVLDEVATQAHQRGEPGLTALCVGTDGRIGDGYRASIARLGGAPVDDAEQHAAEQRFACYQRFGATMPADGGRPSPSRRVVEARRAQSAARAQSTRRAPAARQPERPVVVCPRCFMQLPATGICDSCG